MEISCYFAQACWPPPIRLPESDQVDQDSFRALTGSPGGLTCRRVCPSELLSGPPELADIEDSDDEAAIARPFAAIGRDAHEMPDPVDCLDGLYDCLAARGHAR